MIQGLYEVRKNESEKLFSMWLDAFCDYPKLEKAFTDKDKRLAAIEMTVRFYGMYDLKYGHVYSVDENIDDAIAIVDSEQMKCTQARYIAAGSYSKEYRAAKNRLSPEEQKKYKKVFAELDALESTMNIPYPHIYADFLGVRTKCQGEGRGRRLIHTVARYADSRKRPVMLFTNGSENVDFFMKEGFKTIGIAKSDRYGFENVYLVREPE